MPTSVSQDEYLATVCGFCRQPISEFRDGRFWVNGYRCCAICARAGAGAPKMSKSPFGSSRRPS